MPRSSTPPESVRRGPGLLPPPSVLLRPTGPTPVLPRELALRDLLSWHRRGFVRFWAWKSRRAGGRPPIKPGTVELIIRVATGDPRWSRRRIAMELAKLGVDVDKNTVAKYMPKAGGRPRRPSQTWGTFIRGHVAGTLAIDFFTVYRDVRCSLRIRCPVA